jgi:NAD(P)-dependent dehydrogenase (short-subunit alcohol dehydrogenase family)
MNIIINGGSGGIGRETALLFASDRNNQIIVTGRNEARLRDLQLKSQYDNLSVIQTDISRLSEEIEVLKHQIYNRFSKTDILINMAGRLVTADFLSISEEDSRSMMETNFFGPARIIRLVAPIMPPGSHIVNISSMGGFQGSSKYRGLAVYSASKAAISCLSECLAGEFSNLGISVNCLALGSVQTEMFETAFPGFKAQMGPMDMASFVVWFAVNGHKYFNGKVLPVSASNP